MPDWLSMSVLKDILLSLIALYGAVLSTFNYIQSIRKDRRAVIVIFINGEAYLWVAPSVTALQNRSDKRGTSRGDYFQLGSRSSKGTATIFYGFWNTRHA